MNSWWPGFVLCSHIGILNGLWIVPFVLQEELAHPQQIYVNFV